MCIGYNDLMESPQVSCVGSSSWDVQLVVCNLFRNNEVSMISPRPWKFVGGINQIVDSDGFAVANLVSATTFKYRMGCDGAGTNTFNGATSARLLGGVMNSWIYVEEIMV